MSSQAFAHQPNPERLQDETSQPEPTAHIDGVGYRPVEFATDRIVTSGEVQTVIRTADHLLDTFGEAQQLSTGDDVTVSAESVEHETEEGVVYLRLMRYEKPRRIGKERLRDMYLVYDKDPSPSRLRIDNPHFIRLESGDDISPGIYVEQGMQYIPAYNDPEMVDFVRETVMEILDQCETNAQLSEEQKADPKIAKLIADLREWRQNREGIMKKTGAWWDGKNWREKRTYRRVLFGAIGAVAGLGITGGIMALAHSQTSKPSAVETFDEQGFGLDGGTVLSIGESGHPEFSFDLLQSEELAASEIPELGDHDSIDQAGNFGPNVNDGQDVEDKADISNLREIVMNSSKDGKNEETVYVDFDSPEDQVRVWTDEADRTDEFTVTVDNDSVTVRWDGQERENEDDPRIVLQRIPADQSSEQTQE